MHRIHACMSIVVTLAALANYSDAISLSPRIVGGSVIRDRCRAPYNSMVALQFDADFSPVTFCSAVMMTDTFLVTTAQCLFTGDLTEKWALVALFRIVTTNKLASAVVGEKDTIMRNEPYEQRIPIMSFKIHYFFNSTTRANNIGLIQLASPARLSSCVKPAFRMEEDPKACADVDDSCQINGWGSYTVSSSTNSRLPRYAPVTVFSDIITQLMSSAAGELPPVGSLYAEALNPFQKACFFDWGGVVSCKRNGYDVLRGIIGDLNCNNKQSLPVVILDIPQFQSWIDRCTKDWENCPSLQGKQN